MTSIGPIVALEYVGTTIVHTGSALVCCAEKIAIRAAAFLYSSCNRVAAEVTSATFSFIRWTSQETKLTALREQVPPATQQTIEACSRHAFDYLQHHFNEAHSIPKQLRPEWLQAHYNETWGLTFFGTIAATLFNRNQAAMRELIELTLLNQFVQMRNRFTTKAQENKLFLVDLLVTHLEALTNHFEAPHYSSFERAQFQEDLVKFLFPNGAADLEVPGPDFLRSTLQQQTLQIIQQDVIPYLVETVAERLSDRHLRQRLLERGVKGLTHFVQVGIDLPETQNQVFPSHQTLNSTCTRTVQVVLRAFSPEHFVLASSYLTEERIAPHITNRVLPALLTFNFRELLDQSFAASPPFAPIKTISLAEYEASQMTNHDESIDQATHKRITHELTELPKTHEGIKKLLAQIGEEPPQAEQNFFGNLFANMQKMAVNYFGPALIASHTQKISQKAFQKLWQDDRLIPHMAAQSIKILASSTR